MAKTNLSYIATVISVVALSAGLSSNSVAASSPKQPDLRVVCQCSPELKEVLSCQGSQATFELTMSQEQRVGGAYFERDGKVKGTMDAGSGKLSIVGTYTKQQKGYYSYYTKRRGPLKYFLGPESHPDNYQDSEVYILDLNLITQTGQHLFLRNFPQEGPTAYIGKTGPDLNSCQFHNYWLSPNWDQHYMGQPASKGNSSSESGSELNQPVQR